MLEANGIKVLQAVERFENSKALGLDGIPNMVLELALKFNTKPFTELFLASAETDQPFMQSRN